jgi:2-oxoisovalerate dehydrogenase E1 component
MCGIGAEIAQAMNELCYDDLDAPAGRIHTAPTSHPFAPVLERAMLVDAPRIVRAAREVMAGHAPVPDHWYAGNRSLGGLAPAPAAPQPAAQAAANAVAPGARAGPGEPITMPFGDLTVSEGKLVKWLKAIGDRVAAGEVVAEVETDKAVVEIEAPVRGTISAIEQPVGAVVPMGGRIGAITPEH